MSQSADNEKVESKTSESHHSTLMYFTLLIDKIKLVIDHEL